MRLITKNLIILLVTISISYNAYGRFKTLDDSVLSYDSYRTDLLINKDGTYEETVELKFTILREQGRAIASKYILYYNVDCEKLDILSAKTILQNQEYIVNETMIEDKPVANNMPGFDTKNQVAISFPKPEVGSQIYLKYKINHHTVPLENQFFQEFIAGIGGYWKSSKFSIDSEIPLKTSLNDPTRKLSFKTKKFPRKPGYIEKSLVSVINPFSNDRINEAPNSAFNPERHASVAFSSYTNWNEMGADLAKKYEKVLEKPLPAYFSDIVKTASEEKDFIKQLNIVTSMLNEKVEYFGDWRTINGKFIAQDFTKVAEKQSGDCKDFATITTKILRELGYKANVALVYRGAGVPTEYNKLPTMGAFNHAILMVLDKEGKKHWIDPTNSVSMADGIFEDIAEKYSLILDVENSQYEQLPSIDPNHAKTSITSTLTLDKIVETDIIFSGEEARYLTGAQLYVTEKTIQDYIYNKILYGVILDRDRFKFNISPSLTGRIVEPITIYLKYHSPNIFYKTNNGFGYYLNIGSIDIMKSIIESDTNNDENDLYMGQPRTLEFKTIIQNAKAQNLDNMNFVLDTDFLYLSRNCSFVENDIVINEKAIIKRSWIKSTDIKAQDFRSMRARLNKHFGNYFVIIDAPKKKSWE